MIYILSGIIIGLLVAILIAVFTLHNARERVAQLFNGAGGKATIVDMSDPFEGIEDKPTL